MRRQLTAAKQSTNPDRGATTQSAKEDENHATVN
jgi:hypothetical protein